MGKKVIPLGLEICRIVHSFVSRNQCQLDISGYILPIAMYYFVIELDCKRGGGLIIFLRGLSTISDLRIRESFITILDHRPIISKPNFKKKFWHRPNVTFYQTRDVSLFTRPINMEIYRMFTNTPLSQV